jgi:type IVB pilus formation R64 PilN family outer membrane protein
MTFLNMAIVIMALLQTQRLPAQLQVSQLESAQATNQRLVVAVSPQAPPPTALPQIPAVQLEERQQPGTSFLSQMTVRNADLRAFLSALAQAAGLNLSMSPEITGTVSVDFNNVTLDQALDAVLTPLNLQYRIDGNLLRVTRPVMQTRQFKFDYITTARTLGRSLSASASAGIGGVAGLGGAGGTTGGGGVTGGSSTSLSGTESTNLLNDIQQQLDALKSPTGRIIYNRMAGIIFVTDFPGILDSMEAFLETVQNAVNRQVVIEARFVEVKLNDDFQAGINWRVALGNVFTFSQTFAEATAVQAGVTYGDFSLIVSALSTQGTVNVRSAPTVSTLNNQPAVIRVGTQDVFFTTTTQVDPRTGTIVQTATTPSTINEGVVLDVTPHISDDGIITMNIHPTITERTGVATSPQGSSVPIVDIRETDTVVRVAEGQTVVIAGLISDRQTEETSKVPFLGDIPVVKHLFRKTRLESRKTDLVVLLTPRVLTVRSAADYTRSRIEEQERLRELGK